MRRLILIIASFVTAITGIALFGLNVSAHPLTQGSMRVHLSSAELVLDLSIPFEEIVIASSADPTSPAPASMDQAVAEHGGYLLQHIQIFANGTPLNGTVELAEGPAKSGSSANTERVRYRIRYPSQSREKIQKLRLTQNILREVEFAPGNPWEATFAVSIEADAVESIDGLLLTSSQPLEWNAQTGAGSTIVAYAEHGILHILTGYDHLLFIASLVLAAVSFWDLFKVVGAFTIAHGATLALSVFNIVRLPERIVEPMIAASIVFVALENIFFPERSRSWSRIGIAFFFGLFHGLGYAGGLIEAMEQLPAAHIVAALISFSVGVEIAHQMAILPAFGILRAVRKRQESGLNSNRAWERLRRITSAGVALAGAFYFAAALR